MSSNEVSKFKVRNEDLRFASEASRAVIMDGSLAVSTIRRRAETKDDLDVWRQLSGVENSGREKDENGICAKSDCKDRRKKDLK